MWEIRLRSPTAFSFSQAGEELTFVFDNAWDLRTLAAATATLFAM